MSNKTIGMGKFGTVTEVTCEHRLCVEKKAQYGCNEQLAREALILEELLEYRKSERELFDYIAKPVPRGSTPSVLHDNTITVEHGGVDLRKLLEQKCYFRGGKECECKEGLPIWLADRITYGLLQFYSRMIEWDILHNDLRPENILINHLGDPKIIDFGLAVSDENPPAPLPFQDDTHFYLTKEGDFLKWIESSGCWFNVSSTLKKGTETPVI